MKGLFYLDNSATTKPCDEAVQAALDAMKNNYGNPSSLYEFGMLAEDIITSARGEIAKKLLCREDEIFFTSCGSESNSTAIFGAVKLGKRRGKHIITTTIEHPSVLEPTHYLEKNGYEVTYLKPNENGNISVEELSNAIRPDTVLVSMMYVNNEVGSILPVEKIRPTLIQKNSNALIHIDCVQAFGKLNINPQSLGADLLSFSAHKIHGIKGAGALYVKKGTNLPPFLLGGGQEKGLRSGTEAVPAIAAFGAAVKALPNTADAFKKITEINNYCRNGLKQFDNVLINSAENGSPYILNLSFLGYRSETLLHFLERSLICVSSGSACSKGKGSYVLREMGLKSDRVDSALRLSFSPNTTLDEIDAFLTALKGATSLIRNKNR